MARWYFSIAPMVLGPTAPSTASSGLGPPWLAGTQLSRYWTVITSEGGKLRPPRPTDPLMALGMVHLACRGIVDAGIEGYAAGAARRTPTGAVRPPAPVRPPPS